MESFWDHLHNITDAKSIISQGGFYLLLVVVFAETGLFFGFFFTGRLPAVYGWAIVRNRGF